MRTLSTIGLLFVPIVAWSQQSPKTDPAPVVPISDKVPAVSKTPAEILEENRDSIAVIVAAGDTSLKLGTGFFVRPSGLLLTNFHVVEGAELVGVKLPRAGRIFWAKKARGFDLGNDLVVLEVETPAAKPIVMGDSEEVHVAEKIVVVGNPQGLEETVSDGLISGIREMDGRKLFQISAPISEGSSGGPVFDERGNVIAVVVASIKSGQNLNFAIPINYAKPLINSPSERLISSLPKRPQGDEKSEGSRRGPEPGSVTAQLAVQAISKIAGEIRSCAEHSGVVITEEEQSKFRKLRMGPPSDVRFYAKASDSLVAPYEGVIEFSIAASLSPYYFSSREKASAAPDYPFVTSTIRHRHVFRIADAGVQLDNRTRYDDKSEGWILEQGKPTECWERPGYQ